MAPGPAAYPDLMEPVIDQAFAAALYSDGDAGLDTGASLLAADPSADDELHGRGEEFVRRAWSRGWQPADLVRFVRRELDATGAGLVSALITAEAARYGRLPPRWDAQLAELPAPAPRNRPDRFSYATALLELCRLLLRLPAIEPVGPPPGTAADRLHRPPARGEPRMLTRIRALLAKAEATGFPEEAEALTTKAQELMARHSIDDALLAARTHSTEQPGARRIGIDAPYETAKAILLDTVASANRCRAVWDGDHGFTTVVGFEADLEAVELLFTSLPVLAARDVAVTDTAERMFPRTTSTRVRGVTDADGWTHGTAAADRARVRGQDPPGGSDPRITP